MEAYTGILGQYFSEVEPTERKRLYVLLQEEVLLPAALERLYKLRYVDPQEPDREVDLFLWHFVNLLQYYGAPGLFRQKTRRAVQETLRALGLEAGNTETEEERRLFYWEYRNAARRYFGTVSAPSYGRKLFGTLAGREDEKLLRMREDARKLSFGNAEKYDLAEESELICRAVNDEFMAFFNTKQGLAEDPAAGERP